MTPEWSVLILLRWLNFTTVAGLFGMALFVLYAPPAAREAFLARSVTRLLFIAGGALALASTFGWASATLIDMAGETSAVTDVGAWRTFVFDTSFGAAWAARGTLATTLVVCATRYERVIAWIAALTACLLVSQSWIGHIASLAPQTRWGVAIAHALHVWGAGVWFGGLTALTISLRELRERGDRGAQFDVLASFSAVGLAAVLAILIGGLINVAALSTFSPTTILVSGWGRTLVLKIMLVLAMITLACLNRFVLMPRLAAGKPSASSRIARSVVLEQILAIAVLGLTAALGLLDPMKIAG